MTPWRTKRPEITQFAEQLWDLNKDNMGSVAAMALRKTSGGQSNLPALLSNVQKFSFMEGVIAALYSISQSGKRKSAKMIDADGSGDNIRDICEEIIGTSILDVTQDDWDEVVATFPEPEERQSFVLPASFQWQNSWNIDD